MISCLLATTVSAPAVSFEGTTALICGRLIDAEMDSPGRPGVIVVRDGEIAEIRPGNTAPEGAEVIDISSMTRMRFVMKDGAVIRHDDRAR